MPPRRKRYLDNAAPADNRVITIGQIPKGYVDSHGDMVVRTPKGVKTTLAEAYKNYNKTPVAVENIPGLTDYLIKQDNPDIQQAAHMKKVAGDRFVHRLGEERDKALMSIAAGAIGGGALASGLALAPVATLGGISGGILGEKAWNKLYGNTWGQDVERWTNGYIPAAVGEYLNPGSLIGGVLGSQIGVGSRLAYDSFLKAPQTKRLVEVAMRTSSKPDPSGIIWNNIRKMPLEKAGRTQLKNVGKYILRGTRTNDPINTPYRTLAYGNGAREYTGLTEPIVEESISKKLGYVPKDIIDAYLYGDKIDSNILKFIDKGKNFGIHDRYINNVYPDKARNIQVYEGGIGYDFDPNMFVESSTFGEPVRIMGAHSSISGLNGTHINSAGHLRGLDANYNLIDSDIWKFQPNEYSSKWDISGLKKLALRVVDDIGTPVLIRTKPYRMKYANL